MHLDRRLLGWGLFFILLGAIPIATKAGLLDPTLVGQWPLLWPVLLIAWGLGLLLRGTPLALLGGALSAITFGLMGGGALATGFGGVPFASGCTRDAPATAFAARSGDLGTTARVDFELNCGTLAVSTADGTAWGVTGSDRDGKGPTIQAGPAALSLESDADRNLFGSHGRTTWNVTLPRSPVIALGLTLNAGEGTLDLAGAAISTVSMTLNAGELHLDLSGTSQLGDANGTVNAGAASIDLPAGERKVNLSLNAGNLDVCVPPGSALRVTWAGALGSNNFDSNGLVKVDDRTWTSPAFDANQPHAELHVSANAGSFELHIGGACNA